MLLHLWCPVCVCVCLHADRRQGKRRRVSSKHFSSRTPGGSIYHGVSDKNDNTQTAQSTHSQVLLTSHQLYSDPIPTHTSSQRLPFPGRHPRPTALLSGRMNSFQPPAVGPAAESNESIRCRACVCVCVRTLVPDSPASWRRLSAAVPPVGLSDRKSVG